MPDQMNDTRSPNLAATERLLRQVSPVAPSEDLAHRIQVRLADAQPSARRPVHALVYRLNLIDHRLGLFFKGGATDSAIALAFALAGFFHTLLGAALITAFNQLEQLYPLSLWVRTQPWFAFGFAALFFTVSIAQTRGSHTRGLPFVCALFAFAFTAGNSLALLALLRAAGWTLFSLAYALPGLLICSGLVAATWSRLRLHVSSLKFASLKVDTRNKRPEERHTNRTITTP